MVRQALTTIRMPQELLDHADSLVARLERAPIMLAAAGILNRSTVIRVALRLGLQELERKHAEPGTARPATTRASKRTR